MQNKVLVTGASGFIGRQTLCDLLSRGFEVHAVSRSGKIDCPPELRGKSSATGPVQGQGNGNGDSKGVEDPRLNEPKLIFHAFDLLRASRSELTEFLQKVMPSHLLHFAWSVEPGLFWSSADNLSWVGASLELIKSFAQVGGKRVMFAGSCAEYDWSAGVLNEQTTSLTPSTLYGVCKKSLFEVYSQFCQTQGLSAAWGRIFFQYGPFEPEAKLVSSVMRALATGHSIDLTHGLQVRNYMHVQDVARAFVHVLTSDFKGPVNIAASQSIELKQLIAMIAQIAGGELSLFRFGVKAAPKDEPIQLVADTILLYDQLGFEAKYTLESGLRQALRAFEVSHQLKGKGD